jgi:nucleotide-binding universal stress UspA family protein
MTDVAAGPVVAGYNGDEVSDLALEHAAAYARALDAPLLVVAVEPTLVTAGMEVAPAAIAGGPPVVAPWPSEEAEEELHREWDARLDAARIRLEAEGGVEVELVHRTGDPGEELLAVSRDRGAQLLVVGTHEKGFLDRLFARSVSESVVRKAQCDVLVVHMPHAQAPSS